MVQDVEVGRVPTAPGSQPLASAAGASSPIGADPSRGWVAGAFTVQTECGGFDIAGWIKAPFALDFRVFDDNLEWFDAGWYLTHIPTGFGVCGIIANLPAAMEVADQIREIADWTFTDKGHARTVAPAFVEFRDQCSAKIVRGGPLAGPLFGMVNP